MLKYSSSEHPDYFLAKLAPFKIKHCRETVDNNLILQYLPQYSIYCFFK